jgi:hypothetical protein
MQRFLRACVADTMPGAGGVDGGGAIDWAGAVSKGADAGGVNGLAAAADAGDGADLAAATAGDGSGLAAGVSGLAAAGDGSGLSAGMFGLAAAASAGDGAGLAGASGLIDGRASAAEGRGDGAAVVSFCNVRHGGCVGCYFTDPVPGRAVRTYRGRRPHLTADRTRVPPPTPQNARRSRGCGKDMPCVGMR